MGFLFGSCRPHGKPALRLTALRLTGSLTSLCAWRGRGAEEVRWFCYPLRVVCCHSSVPKQILKITPGEQRWGGWVDRRSSVMKKEQRGLWNLTDLGLSLPVQLCPSDSPGFTGFNLLSPSFFLYKVGMGTPTSYKSTQMR